MSDETIESGTPTSGATPPATPAAEPDRGTTFGPSALLTPANAMLGQLGTLFVMGLAAAEATLVLAIIVVIARRFGTTKTSVVSTLKG